MARDPRPKPPYGGSEAAWEAYDQEESAWQQRQAERRSRGRSPGRAAREGLAAAGFVASVTLTGAQAYDDPAQNGLNTQGNYVDSEAENRRTNQARGHRQNTTYKGYQQGGSSRTD